MRIRQITALAASALVVTAGIVAAPAAHAAGVTPASLTANCDNSAGTATTFVGPIGSSFTITNSGSSTGCMIISLTGATASGLIGANEIAPGSTATFTITGPGGFHISAGGYVGYTIEVGESSTGGGEPTPETLPGSPTNIVATPGNGIVKLTWSPPTSMGTGDFLQYGFNFQRTGTLGETLACKTTTTTCTITGLANGQSYTFIGYTQSTIGWSPSARASATPSESAKCTRLTADVSPSGATAVTTPVGADTTIVTMPYIAVPYGGTVSTPALGTYAPATGFGAMGGDYATFYPQVDGACLIKVTVGTGALMSLGVHSAPTGGARELTVGSGQPVYVWGVKPGVYDVTMTSGSLAATPKVKVGTLKNAAYSITATPTTASITAGGISTVDFVVTDAFGNPVPAVELNMSASGQVALAGYATSGKATTDANGKVTQTYIAGSLAGNGTISASGAASNGALAWASNYTRPLSFSAEPITSATASVTVNKAVTKSIAIVGERTTVSGKSGIRVEGTTEGFAADDIVNPYLRLAGQTGYTKGIDVTVDIAGEFTWQRKTGKKAYVYFMSADGTVKSNTIIIPTA